MVVALPPRKDDTSILDFYRHFEDFGHLPPPLRYIYSSQNSAITSALLVAGKKFDARHPDNAISISENVPAENEEVRLRAKRKMSSLFLAEMIALGFVGISFVIMMVLLRNIAEGDAISIMVLGVSLFVTGTTAITMYAALRRTRN